jgi:CDP-diacylglycerol---serine O-phosphatidyltransferase
MRKVHILPNLLTLANAFCGLLAICKAIDALQYGQDPDVFYAHMETACKLVFLGMVLDALDGKVARMVGGESSFGAQLDSFADMLAFGVAPAILAKVLIEHEAGLYGWSVNTRWTLVAASVYSVMAILRLARFNLENDPDPEAHRAFKGLPSPSAAGSVCATIWMYLSLRHPDLEKSDGVLTPMGGVLKLLPDLRMSTDLRWFLLAIGLMLPIVGLLMVSRIRNVHMTSYITGRGLFVTLVTVVVGILILSLFPVPALFFVFNGYVVFGLVRVLLRKRGGQAGAST